MIEPPERTVSFEVTVDDTLTTVRFIQRRTRQYLLWMTLVVTLSGAVLLILRQPFGFFPLIFGAVGLAVRLTGVFERWAVERQIRSVIGTTRSCSIAEEGLRHRSVTGSGVIPWSSITKIVDDRDVIAFFRDRILVYVIPVSAFASPIARASFVSESRARIEAAQAAL